MGAMEAPQYTTPVPGFEPTHPLFVQVVDPPPLPWSVRHPHLTTLLVAAAFVICVAILVKF